MYYKKKKYISRYKHTFITFFLRYVIPIFTSIGALHSQPSDSIDIRLFRLTIAAIAISFQIVRTNTSKFSSTIIVAKNTKNARVSLRYRFISILSIFSFSFRVSIDRIYMWLFL